jgi:hypothetical protein
LIHGDSQRLKNLCCRMMIAPAASFDAFDNLDELCRSLQWTFFSFGDDRLSDAPRLGLFAVIPKDSFQLFYRK